MADSTIADIVRQRLADGRHVSDADVAALVAELDRLTKPERLDLKPCPFCGFAARIGECQGDTSVRGGKAFFWVEHYATSCPIGRSEMGPNSIETDYYDTPAEAAAAWNTRHDT